MAKKINFGAINTEAINAFSEWNKVDIFGSAIRATSKQAVTTAQATLDAILASRAQAVAGGMSVDDAIRMYSTVQAQADLEKAQNAYKDTCATLRNRQSGAKALVPDGLYQAYVLKNQTADSEPFCLGVREFLINLGLDAPSVASAKFAETIAVRIGRKNASGKAKAEGHKSADLTKQAFADRFIREFLEFCLVDKGVLDQTEDGSLKMHDFEAEAEAEAENNAEGKAEAEADAKALFRQVVRFVHPDETGVDTAETREFMFRACQNRDNAEELKKILEEATAYFENLKKGQEAA